MDIRCAGCGRPPAEIGEYVEAADQEEMTPDQYVQTNEGTFNPENGHFWCTACYIKVGLPLGVAP